MPLVTLIGEKLAKVGNEFVYLNANNDCRNCKLKTVCFNLKPGRRYKVTKIREKRHSCSVHDGVTAVVEVQEMPINAVIDKTISKDFTEKIEKKDCNNIGCTYYELCNNIALQRDKNYKITKKYDDIIDCPIGYNLQKADLTD
jgi:uncharacterized protein (UPF0179 family)